MPQIRQADDPQATAKWLDDLLVAQCRAATGHGFANEPLVLEAWDGAEKLGGIAAKFGTHWAFIEFLALSEAARGSGTGRALVEAVEDAARARGKTGIWLDTYSFQAPGFYERMGYTRFGTLPDYPAGHARHFYAKRLDGKPMDHAKDAP